SPAGLPPALERYRWLDSFAAGLAEKPDLVSINSYTDSHADYAVAAMEAGAHVFVEKPLASTVADAERVVATARRTGRKLVIGYILRHHPSWIEFVAQARKLGPPFVMRMNLNQQSAGAAWEIHKRLMESTSPVVDCGVHYVDVMLQITDSPPAQVRGMGVRLSSEIADTQVNYGHLQIIFADGSVGWYEAGWGPMISETAFFVKDVMGPRGSASIVMHEGAASADVDTHTRTARRPSCSTPSATTGISIATCRMPSARLPWCSPATAPCAKTAPSNSEDRTHGLARSDRHLQELWRDRRPQERRARGQDRRVRGLRRPVRLREVDAAAGHRRARRADLGRPSDRRQADERRATGKTRHCHGVPELRTLPSPDGREEHEPRPVA